MSENHKTVSALSTKSIDFLSSLNRVCGPIRMNEQSDFLVQNQEYSSNKSEIIWSIKKSALNEKVSYGQYILSPTIKVGSASTCALLLYPSGKNKLDIKYVSLDVQLKNFPKNIYLECEISIIGEDGSVNVFKTFASEINVLKEINFNDFFPVSDLHCHIVNDNLKIRCCIRCGSKILKCVSSKLTYQVHAIPNSSRDYMKSIFQNGKYSDVILEMDSKKIMCHKLILASESPALSILLKSSNKNNFDMSDKKAAVIENLLNFIYNGSIHAVNFSQICPLYIAAEEFGVSNLKDICSVFLSCSVTANNVPYLFQLSTSYKDKWLMEACFTFFKAHNIENLSETFMKFKLS